MILHKIRSVGLYRLGSTYIYRSVISSSNQTYDKNLTLDKLQNEWMHHSPYFWLERMTFLVTFGFDMPEAGFRAIAKIVSEHILMTKQSLLHIPKPLKVHSRIENRI